LLEIQSQAKARGVATVHFYDSLKRLNLDVERVASVHGPSTTMADLGAAVEKKRQSSSKRAAVCLNIEGAQKEKSLLRALRVENHGPAV
jgi:hypothetical protein